MTAAITLVKARADARATLKRTVAKCAARSMGEFERAKKAITRGDLPAAREAMEAAIHHAESAQVAIQRIEHAEGGNA